MMLGDLKVVEPIVTVVADGPTEIVSEIGAPRSPRPWRHWKTAVLVALPLLLAVYVYGAARGVLGVVKYQPPEYVAAVSGEPDGAALYIRNWARCHGTCGKCDGLASPYLDPPARKFGQEKFQLGTTSTGIPSDDDIVYLIHHGIPGTAMPEFPNLADTERRAIAQHIRRLAYSGLYTKRFALLAKDEEPDPKEVHEWVAKQLTVGDQLPVPARLTHPEPNAVTHGKEIFRVNCATCHGPEGKGDGPGVKDMKLENGRPTRPRDLAAGVYKGGGEANRLFARISLGMPGTPMPDLRALPPEDRADLVHFVRSLSAK